MNLRKKPKIKEPDLNAAKTTINDFIRYYNQNIPISFPQASFQSLEKFRATHAGLFDGSSEEWTIDKHRKKVMDWLSSYTEAL